MKRKVLWIGDAVIESGFSKCTHNILKYLLDKWNVEVLGLNYNGDPHHLPYPVYPCLPGGDFFGVGRVVELVNKFSPDFVFVQNDPWNIPVYMEKAGNVPTIATMAVDGKNCSSLGLNGLAMAIFWTEFGLKEARAGGYTGPAKVVPLGVDLEIYKPVPKHEARKHLNLPDFLKDAYIVGNVNRNQPRKRLDLTVAYFAEWIKSFDIRDAYLFLHVAPTGENGYNVSQLMQYYGLSNRLIVNEPDIGFGVTEGSLVNTYSCFDVQINTGQGEGWGLTTMEGMACGIPQIVPDWSALGEWAKEGTYLIECTSEAVTPNKVNVIGGIPDRRSFIQAFQDLYKNTELRKQLSSKGYSIVSKPEYHWKNIATQVYKATELGLNPIGKFNGNK